ncbi:DNA-binding anti-repressor SinI [Thalassobacillus pellis]|nr:DNA-binding anti-repressor SinI [Thalassobacillus pellis]MBM7551447.1 DNA-binding transcriptional MerR regulator [Thalassobacillus pellis]
MTRVTEDERLDDEWIVLIKEAKQLGLSIEEIEVFIKKEGKK